MRGVFGAILHGQHQVQPTAVRPAREHMSPEPSTRIHETTAKSILRRRQAIDGWFVSRCGMNLYRGCAHDCSYCDGRAEGYYVEGEFGRDVVVKVNAPALLARELDPRRKRKPFHPGFVLLGGGVGDSYQPVEQRYCLARRALQEIAHYGYATHVLTKSTLVERDRDVLHQIDRRARALVSFSISTVDDSLAAVFEPHVPPPSERLAALARLKRHGLHCGVFLMPVVPFVTDTPEQIDRSVAAAARHGADFVLFGGMTLKVGRQRDHFLAVLRRRFPDMVRNYDIIYGSDKWGNASGEYYRMIDELFYQSARRHGVPLRIPLELCRPVLTTNDFVTVALDHIHYVLRLRGQTSYFGAAARSVARLDVPLETKRDRLRELHAVGPQVARVIRELLDTGKCGYLSALMRGDRGAPNIRTRYMAGPADARDHNH
ncbi:MAG: radical SAM protein [Chitinivibrionales bacterium]|nr:radical SAM protein [Chitinivibrionales bacterium]